MSTQPVAKTEYVPVCDLCGKPVDTYGHRDWSTLNIGHGGITNPSPDPKKRAIKFFRKRHGDRASAAPKGDYRSWEWDFHGECLVDALMPLVTDEARRDAGQ